MNMNKLRSTEVYIVEYNTGGGGTTRKLVCSFAPHFYRLEMEDGTEVFLSTCPEEEDKDTSNFDFREELFRVTTFNSEPFVKVCRELGNTRMPDGRTRREHLNELILKWLEGEST